MTAPLTGRLRHDWTAHDLAGMTWPEADRRLGPGSIALLPIGAIEAHGPHLPLDTDVIIARATAGHAAYRLAARGDVPVVLPPITYGVSRVGTCFAGTTPVGPELVAGLVATVLAEVARQGVCRFAVVNAHLEPAHVAAVEAGIAAFLAGEAGGCTVAFPDQRQPRWAAMLSEEFRRGARHAGGYETSLLLAAAPETVREDMLVGLPPVWVDLPERLRAGATTFSEAGGVDGYFGDPASASAAEGAWLFGRLAEIVLLCLDEAVAGVEHGR